LAWRIEFDSSAEKALRKVDPAWQARIVAYLEELVTLPDPRVRGKSLTGKLTGLWRYRTGDYRIVCQIQDDVLIVRVIKIGHRRDVYK
jgi:mRNA interferase RelE/StbE